MRYNTALSSANICSASFDSFKTPAQLPSNPANNSATSGTAETFKEYVCRNLRLGLFYKMVTLEELLNTFHILVSLKSFQ